MKKISVFLMSIVLLAVMGLNVSAVAPTDGKYEDGIYYMTGNHDTEKKDTGLVTIAVVASTLGLIIIGIAVNRKFKKN